MLIVGIMWTKLLLTDPEHPVFVTLGDWHVSLSGAPNVDIVQNHINIALLNVF